MKRGRLASIAVVTGVPAGAAGGERSGKSYKVGYIADLSGPMQDNYSPLLEGFQFYVKELNAKRRHRRHPVNVAVRDDQLDATKAASMALELATSEGVNSIWGMSQTRTHWRFTRLPHATRFPQSRCSAASRNCCHPAPSLRLFGGSSVRSRRRSVGQAGGQNARTARAPWSATASRRLAASRLASTQRAPPQPVDSRPGQCCFRRR